MKFLIIGSQGFIGSHLLQRLRDFKCEAYGCDVIADYRDKKYFHFDSVDTHFEKIFSLEKFDVCFNCSGSASVPFSYEHPASDFQLNVVHVFQILDAIRKNNSECRFIQLSSAAVYGNPQMIPVHENIALQPVSIYGHHKVLAENICNEFHKIYGLNVKIARIFSAYGNGLQKQIFWDLAKKAVIGKEVELFGDGNESRDFIFIDDLISALLLISEYNKGDSFEVFNVASGEEIKIKDAAKLFFQLYNPLVQYRFSGKKREGDPDRWRADISKLTSLGFKNNTSFKDGISLYVSWLKAFS